MRFVTSILAVSVIVLPGCSDHTTPTDIPDTPLFNFTNGPDSPGPFIVRYEDEPQGMIFFAYSEGLTVFLGFDPVESCTVGHTTQLWDMQWIHNPQGGFELLKRGEDLITSVWPFVDSDYCPLVTTTEPLASGLSNVVTHSHRTPQLWLWNYKAVGWLTTPTGEPVHFNLAWVRQYRYGSWAEPIIKIDLR